MTLPCSVSGSEQLEDAIPKELPVLSLRELREAADDIRTDRLERLDALDAALDEPNLWTVAFVTFKEHVQGLAQVSSPRVAPAGVATSSTQVSSRECH